MSKSKICIPNFLESDVNMWLKSKTKAGLALKEIKDHKIYLHQGFKTFSEYTVSKFNISENYANRLILGSKVVTYLVENHIVNKTKSSYLNEGLLRPLGKLAANNKYHLLRSVFTNANKIASKENKGRITAKILQVVVNKQLKIN